MSYQVTTSRLKVQLKLKTREIAESVKCLEKSAYVLLQSFITEIYCVSFSNVYKQYCSGDIILVLIVIVCKSVAVCVP